MTTEPTHRYGQVAVLGLPNAGKSTLVNRIVGSKVSIVTHKAQTTRSRIHGIAILDSSQILFVDTPGVFTTRRKRDQGIANIAWGSLADASAAMVIIDAKRGQTENLESFLSIYAKRVPTSVASALVLNKIDLVRRHDLLALAQALHKDTHFVTTFMVSATTGDGVKDLGKWIAQTMPEEQWLFPEDQAATMSLRLLAAEITREQMLLRLHDEIPYAAAVKTLSWKTTTKRGTRIEQDIYVTREAHKRITIGRNGSTLSAIGRSARLQIAELIGTQVHLFLHVRVRPEQVAAALDPGKPTQS